MVIRTNIVRIVLMVIIILNLWTIKSRCEAKAVLVYENSTLKADLI
jgi:hypothetical protein